MLMVQHSINIAATVFIFCKQSNNTTEKESAGSVEFEFVERSVRFIFIGEEKFT